MKNYLNLLVLLFLTIIFTYAAEVNIKSKYKILEISGITNKKKSNLLKKLTIEKSLLNTLKLSDYKISETEEEDIKKEIINFFKDDGYKNTTVTILRLDKKIVYNIKLGKPLIFKNIIIKDANNYSKSKLYKLIQFNLGDRFTNKKYKKSINKINNFLLNKNISTPKFTFNIELDKEDMLTARLTLQKQLEKQVIKDIKIYNHTDIPTDLINKNIFLKKGTVYNYNIEQKTYRKLKSLGLFDVVTIEKTNRSQGLQINIYIKNETPTKYKASLGYNTGEKIKVKFKLKTPNISKTLINVNTNVDVTAINQLISVNYGKQYNYNYPYNTVNIEHKKASKYEYYNIKLVAGTKLSFFNVQSNLFFKHSDNKILYDYINNTKGNYNYNSVNFIVKKIKLKKDINNIYYKSGYTFKAGFEYAPASINKEIKFLKMNFEYALRKKIYFNNALWLKMKYKTIQNLGVSLLPTPLLIPVGGTLSNRGLNYEDYYTNSLIELNADIETRVSDNFYVSSLMDSSIFKDIQTNKNENIISVGLGIHYITKIGIFKLDIAKQISANDSNIKYNLGYGYDF